MSIIELLANSKKNGGAAGATQGAKRLGGTTMESWDTMMSYKASYIVSGDIVSKDTNTGDVVVNYTNSYGKTKKWIVNLISLNNFLIAKEKLELAGIKNIWKVLKFQDDEIVYDIKENGFIFRQKITEDENGKIKVEAVNTLGEGGSNFAAELLKD